MFLMWRDPIGTVVDCSMDGLEILQILSLNDSTARETVENGNTVERWNWMTRFLSTNVILKFHSKPFRTNIEGFLAKFWDGRFRSVLHTHGNSVQSWSPFFSISGIYARNVSISVSSKSGRTAWLGAENFSPSSCSLPWLGLSPTTGPVITVS